MRPNWMRLRKWCVALSWGGVTLGFLQAFEMINFAEIVTSFLSVFLSLLVTLLLGGDPTTWMA